MAACAGPLPPSGGGADPPAEVLLPIGETAGNFLLRQQIEYHFQERQGTLEAVVQKRCSELTVVGFTPLGTRAFTIQQRDGVVREEIHATGAWPFPPNYVLLDIQRAYLIPLPEVPPRDGVYQRTLGGEVVLEEWQGGRVRERSFRRASGRPPGRVVVRYAGSASEESPPRRVEIANERYGYELVVTTLSRRDLSCP